MPSIAQTVSSVSSQLLENSTLDTLVPHASEVKIDEILRSPNCYDLDENALLVSSIRQRQVLFFDETVAVYVVLRIPYLNQDTLRSYLSRLTIAVDAHAIDKQQRPPPSREDEQYALGQSKDVLYSGVVQDALHAVSIVHGPGADSKDTGNHILAVWKLEAFLSRPRVRMQNAVIVFTASAALNPVEDIKPQALEDEYLPSQIPADINLLESFKDDPALSSICPHLSAVRVSRVIPTTQGPKGLPRQLRSVSRQGFRAVPTVSSRVRYSRLNTHANKPSIIASLDFDVTPLVGCNILLSNVDVSLTGGTVDHLISPQGPHIPLECRPKDDVTFLYHLRLDATLETASQKPHVRILEISIIAIALLSEDCQPRISMKWRASVDFSAPLNPSFSGPSQHLQRNNRPAKLPVQPHISTTSSSTSVTVGGGRPTTLGPDALPSTELTSPLQGSEASGELGLTITFSGPQDVQVGEVFQWEFFIVNRSSRPRKLALVVIPKRKKTDPKRPAPRPSSAGSGRKLNSVPDAVVDENIVYAMQRNAVLEPAELVCLSTDVRIGPLAPLACHMGELKFIALASGVLNLEAVRVVDLATQETADIRDLPSIISV